MRLPRAVIPVADDLDIVVVEVERLPEPPPHACGRCGYELRPADEGACPVCEGAA